MTSTLGRARAAHWTDDGFLVLPGFVSDDDVTALSDTVDRAWAQRPGQVVVDDLVTGRRTRIADADPDHHFKVNDLYLDDPRVRRIALSERIGAVLAELLGDEPVLCNTLNFDKGSQQPDHLDTLYYTQADCEAMGEDLRPAPGGFWLRKPALEVPAEPPTAPAPGKDLRERMEPLRTTLD